MYINAKTVLAYNSTMLFGESLLWNTAMIFLQKNVLRKHITIRCLAQVLKLRIIPVPHSSNTNIQ